ncbi:hypothetical protein ACEWY4_001917 [Coilia grayii]|uniref:C-type lectin domain-containing protein n=1 Tax=Coilia grayii TaxID=363190 RepID=A0ABD1KUC0_9TELE
MHTQKPRGRWLAAVNFLIVLICVAVGLCVLFIGPSAGRCFSDWEPFGGKCYYFSHDAFNWTASRDKCVSMGGHLVIIDSREEQMYIVQKLNAAEDDFWIGLTDSEREGQWKWVDNTDLKNITFWHHSQPNNSSGINNTYSGEDCAIMRDVQQTEHNWFDQYCAQSNKIMCEAKSRL